MYVCLSQSLLEKRDEARLASLCLDHAGDRLNVIPSPILGLHIRPQELRYSVLYRLGAPIFPSTGPCPACKKESDRFGDHAIVCGSHGERIARHNQLRDAIYQVAASSNLAPRKEENALLPGTSARSADVLIPQWTGSTKQNQGDMFAGTMTHFHLVQLQPEHQDFQDQHLRQD